VENYHCLSNIPRILFLPEGAAMLPLTWVHLLLGQIQLLLDYWTVATYEKG